MGQLLPAPAGTAASSTAQLSGGRSSLALRAVDPAPSAETHEALARQHRGCRAADLAEPGPPGVAVATYRAGEHEEDSVVTA